MNKIKVLIEGYAREKNGVEFASSTATLIQTEKIKIIVDPGMDRKMLVEAFKKENLSSDEINYVFLTHYHLDHSLLAGIFENTKIIDNGEIYSWDGKIESHQGKIPETEIEIIQTPGHDMFHSSLFVKTEEFGRVVIAGDLFWWKDDEEQKTDKESLINHEDPYVKNKKELKESRIKVLAMADYIIPGHGKIFEI